MKRFRSQGFLMSLLMQTKTISGQKRARHVSSEKTLALTDKNLFVDKIF